MHWQDAVNESIVDLAYRYDGEVRYVREANGNAVRCHGDRCRDARKSEIEGHNDWEPEL